MSFAELSLIVITAKLTEKVFKGIFRHVSRKTPALVSKGKGFSFQNVSKNSFKYPL